MNTRSFSFELKTAVTAAKAGGAIVAAAFTNARSSTTKFVDQKSEGLVTQADLSSEQAIVCVIKETFPTHSFLTEETIRDDVTHEHLWVIDPLDGTNNFVHGIPHFAISVAYYRNGIAQCGVVYNPNNDELFAAEQGKGAFRNHQPAHVNLHSALDQTMLATGFYYDRGQIMEATLAAIRDLFRQNIHGIRRFGAATLDLVDVGIGRYGGFFEFTLSPWDFAAAKLFVEEAGGRVTDCKGSPLSIAKSSLLASNGLLHAHILKIVEPYVKVISEEGSEFKKLLPDP